MPTARQIPTGPEDYGRGRRCPRCRCFVCRYNPGPTCWPCQNVEPVLLDVNELARDLADAARRQRREVAV